MKKIKKIKRFIRKWVFADESPDPKGEFYVTTPDGKIMITGDIYNREDEEKAKDLIALALTDYDVTPLPKITAKRAKELSTFQCGK